MRAAILVLLVFTAGCMQPQPEAETLANVSTAANRTPMTNATAPANASLPAPTPPPAPIAFSGHITLMAAGGATPTDALGVAAPAPPAGFDAVLVLTWTATLPTAARLALRIHEAGVLDEEGRVAGSSPLIVEVAGASPLQHALPASEIPLGGFEVHAYTPQDDPAPLVANQDFTLTITYLPSSAPAS